MCQPRERNQKGSEFAPNTRSLQECMFLTLSFTGNGSILCHVTNPYTVCYQHPYEHIISDDETNIHPNTRRRGLSESETAPIRISAYYDPDTIESRNAAEIHALKAVIGAIVNYYENTIRVIPVDGTFYMERFCNSWYNVDGFQNCILYNNGATEYTCQDATVPDSHFKEQYLYYYPTNYSAQVLPGGTGMDSLWL